ncbi:hypothetical protein ACFY93_17780 [Streptomyces sp. NPDC008313]|uniref:hypothetical protein n=1 Tax=Streptomyces sp. NPDC008313 TaxID=3364826 RepID=UPI0036EC0918
MAVENGAGADDGDEGARPTRPSADEAEPAGTDGPEQEGSRSRRARLRALASHRRGRALLATTAAAVLIAAGLTTTWATGTWPFPGNDRYCWGAWQENSGPDFLADEAEEYGERTSAQSAPAPGHPRGTCTVAVGGDGDDTGTTVKVTYGPAPGDTAKRLEWIVDHVGGDAVPVPDGLPGMVAARSGLLVLPERCDTADGRPTAVTLDAETGGAGLGGDRSVAALLVAAANHGMEAAGCAGERPLEVTSPVLTLPARDDTYPDRGCRMPGLEFDDSVSRLVESHVGTVSDDLQSCAVRTGSDDSRFYDMLMVARPRLAALLDGTTGTKPAARGWRGTGVFGDGYKVVRAQCGKRPATFLMLGTTGEESKRFAVFTDAVTRRLGCAPVAPHGGERV